MQALKAGVNHFVVNIFKHYILQIRDFLQHWKRAEWTKYDRQVLFSAGCRVQPANSPSAALLQPS
ncbi:hypothetical protein NUH87_05535 [Pseudomonas batumici]|uniref:hypothetical protein n=1 Tax=Pseudomonas batumici TaxID=226910 RepID=UPI0030CB29E7